jgi:Right handed beta helix region
MSYLIQNVLPRGVTSAVALLGVSALHACSRPGHSPSVPSPPRSAATYYLDCSASQNGNGTKASPWNSLASADAFTFLPGDRLLLNRGTTCNGALTPQGSGAANAPIVIDAYGTGAQPVVSGGSAEGALKLFNQQYWEINNLEITGGNRYGVYVSGNTPNTSINHVYLRNLNVHDATYTSTKRSDSGEVFVSTNAAGQILNDVLIDGVTAHDSHVSEGIFVNAGGAWIETNGVSQPLGSNVTVQNSTAHDVYGDGILITELNNGLLQRNVVYRSGLCPNCTGSTPVGLWEWYCHTCTVQYNESYANQSWGGDGGDFDIDYYNNNNVVQYNYGHDSAGYCVAFFGAGGRASVDNVFRYNVCSNNGRRSDLSKQGEVFVYTWDQGSLNGVQIYNNTFYWNPASNAAAFISSDATYSGSDPRFFKNNIIYATVPGMIQTTSAFVLENNIYWTASASPPTWQFNAATYTTFSAYQAAANQDLHSYYMDPNLSSPNYHAVGRPATAFELVPGSPAEGAGTNVCNGISGCSMGTQDFWGHPLPAGTGYNIGAYQGP